MVSYCAHAPSTAPDIHSDQSRVRGARILLPSATSKRLAEGQATSSKERGPTEIQTGRKAETDRSPRREFPKASAWLNPEGPL